MRPTEGDGSVRRSRPTSSSRGGRGSGRSCSWRRGGVHLRAEALGDPTAAISRARRRGGARPRGRRGPRHDADGARRARPAQSHAPGAAPAWRDGAPRRQRRGHGLAEGPGPLARAQRRGTPSGAGVAEDVARGRRAELEGRPPSSPPTSSTWTGATLASRPFAERRGELAALLRPSSWCLAGRGFVGDGTTVATALGALGFPGALGAPARCAAAARAGPRRVVSRAGRRGAARAAAVPRRAPPPATLTRHAVRSVRVSLDRYRQKRDFSRTPEPAPGAGGLAAGGAADGGAPGGALQRAGRPSARRRSTAPAGAPAPAAPGPSAPGGCGRFVVHRHRASRLHYDLRLEIDGVLASWASRRARPATRDETRFASRTEDHPIEYLDFEGVIPAGEYGAGRLDLLGLGHVRAGADLGSRRGAPGR